MIPRGRPKIMRSANSYRAKLLHTFLTACSIALFATPCFCIRHWQKRLKTAPTCLSVASCDFIGNLHIWKGLKQHTSRSTARSWSLRLTKVPRENLENSAWRYARWSCELGQEHFEGRFDIGRGEGHRFGRLIFRISLKSFSPSE